MQNIPDLTHLAASYGTEPSKGRPDNVQLSRFTLPPTGFRNDSTMPTAANRVRQEPKRQALVDNLTPPSAKLAGLPYLPNRATVFLNLKVKFIKTSADNSEQIISCRHLSMAYLKCGLQEQHRNRDILQTFATADSIQQHVDLETQIFSSSTKRASQEIQHFSNDCFGQLLQATQSELLAILDTSTQQAPLPSNILLKPSEHILAAKAMYISSDKHGMALVMAIKSKPEKYQGKPYFVTWVYDPNTTNNCARQEMQITDPQAAQFNFSDFLGLDYKTQQSRQAYVRDVLPCDAHGNPAQGVLTAYAPVFKSQTGPGTITPQKFFNPQQPYTPRTAFISNLLLDKHLSMINEVNGISDFDAKTCNTMLALHMYKALTINEPDIIHALSGLLARLPESQREALDWPRILFGQQEPDHPCGLKHARDKNFSEAIQALGPMLHLMPESACATLDLAPFIAKKWLRKQPNAKTLCAFEQLQAQLQSTKTHAAGKKLKRHEAFYRAERPQQLTHRI
jgi:hypothetical protein